MTLEFQRILERGRLLAEKQTMARQVTSSTMPSLRDEVHSALNLSSSKIGDPLGKLMDRPDQPQVLLSGLEEYKVNEFQMTLEIQEQSRLSPLGSYHLSPSTPRGVPVTPRGGNGPVTPRR